ncbi:MATE family efflux transporter [Acetatifactor muris]|uniref:Probable multidrug resistance protein NorM n=1 Tax=Acetatifactor muris TaxID=879566 RepID=A0A2K4ZK59_9FIRM|nr:MATE family efflux transporter [Acetatifactor muris]MCI8798894.1 MATE family efflux transporter [Lachnospiraceae bacterium]MCR2049207.1 MATE family efflux transporter [Acetatifactor muris]SOY30874.1 Multidrug export protein MepA [Acetatifactor muris]
MKKDLTQGNVTKNMLLFAGPMILGNLLQQFYNIADTLIVGRFLGPDALAAVGSAYTLMTFLTSILIGMCMGSGALFSYYFGKKENKKMKDCMQLSFLLIGGVTLLLNFLVMLFCRPILRLLQVPDQLMEMMHTYVWIIFMGIFFVFLYNYFAYLLRAVGNSVVPLYFLGSTAVLNVALDLIFVVVCRWGIAGAAAATIIAQAVSGLGLAAYTWIREPNLRFPLRLSSPEKGAAGEILRFSFSSSVQQSVMNFGILMIQGLVNSFGPEVMAAFAAAVKIDSFAYMPAQEFGNAFSLFISQNHGAGEKGRVRQGMRSAVRISLLFCAVISLLVFVFAPYLMLLFVSPEDVNIIATGAGYLRVEGAFYCGIGILFLLYGYYRGVNRPEMSLVLTIISLGTRVLLAYILAPIPQIGVVGIWSAIPIGWILADVTGILYLRRLEKGHTFTGPTTE